MLGFKAGLEIHQQLDSKRKLFNNASTYMKEGNEMSRVVRKLKAVVGDSNEIDVSSSHEEMRNREFEYVSYENETSLVDLDEEPPLKIDRHALEICLSIAKMFNMIIPDYVTVMRKLIIDGTAVSGFQRSVLIGLESDNSFIHTSKGKVKITQLNLEEDSCKKISTQGNLISYSVSRQGIPLIEISTDSSIKDPEHVAETSLKIGRLLRSFNVKRGIGSIRQDVNVSIKDGARVEIKGFQDLKGMSLLVKNEVIRQQNLVKIRRALAEFKQKKIPKMFRDVTSLFKKTKFKVISDKIRNNQGHVFALLLENFGGKLKQEICAGKTLGKEFSDYTRIYGLKGMIHSDEDIHKYGLEKEFMEMRRIFKAKKNDAILIVADEKSAAMKAIDAVYDRANYCFKGVPEETRLPCSQDNITRFARPLSGEHRMSIETDLEPIRVDQIMSHLTLPELLPDKINRYVRTHGIDKNMADNLISNGFDFDAIVKKYSSLNKGFIAQALIEYPKEIRRRYGEELNASEIYDEVFTKLVNGKISKDGVFEIFLLFAQNKTIDYSKFEVLSNEIIEKEVKQIITKYPNESFKTVMGKVMSQLRGKAEGKEIAKLVKKYHK